MPKPVEFAQVVLLFRHIWTQLSPSTQHQIATAALCINLRDFQPSR